MAPNLHFPGFTPISERVYLRNGHEKSKSPSSAHDPTSIVIFGWGDGMLKHLSKYARGYYELFPRAKIVVVLSSTWQAYAQPVNSRIEAMSPVIDAAFTSPNRSVNKERILLHAMSNTGAVFLAATLVAYQQRYGDNRRAPHALLVFDSTPGSPNFASQVGRWSRALALGTPTNFPWFFSITRPLWYIALCLHRAYQWLRGTEPSGIWAIRILSDPAVAPTEPHRLHLYSKEDDIIWWEDLEQNVNQARNLGYKADLEIFDGSPHVGHMRLHPEQYWNAIFSAWKAQCIT